MLQSLQAVSVDFTQGILSPNNVISWVIFFLLQLAFQAGVFL
jgi:hypothetical protein